MEAVFFYSVDSKVQAEVSNNGTPDAVSRVPG
jgi:hypothetical protein